jgi:hypothetical protein
MLQIGLIDKIQAAMYSKANDVIALVYLNVMNKKFAFTVVQNGPRKMGIKTTNKSINVTIVKDSL